MRKSRLLNATRRNFPVDLRVFFFSLAFLSGVVAGYFSCKAIGADGEIKGYIAQYAQVLTSGGAVASVSLLCAAVAYFRLPCTVYLCCQFRRAFYLICCVFLLEGFLLSFAVANFTLTMGRTGTLISLCLFGVRMLFILPVSLSVALRASCTSLEQSGRRTSGQKTARKKNRCRYFLLYPLILVLGIMVELTFVPKLAALALRQIS